MANDPLRREIDKINDRYIINPTMSRSQVVNTEKQRRYELQQLCMKAGCKWGGGFIE